MIVNPVSSKSGKGLNSILKNQAEKNKHKRRKVLHKKPKLKTCLKGGRILIIIKVQSINYVILFCSVLYFSRNLLTIYRKYYNLIGYCTHYQVIDSVCGMKTSNSIWRPFSEDVQEEYALIQKGIPENNKIARKYGLKILKGKKKKRM